MDWTDKKIFTCPRCKDKVSFYESHNFDIEIENIHYKFLCDKCYRNLMDLISEWRNLTN